MTKSVRQLQDNAGASLIELLIALAAGLIVMLAVFETLSALDRRFRSQQTAMAATQEIRSGLEVWESEVRLARGTGLFGGSALQTKGPTSFEFTANLNGFTTTLRSAALPGQSELNVEDARDWPSGKKVVLCSRTRCIDNQLFRDGQRSLVMLAQPLSDTFPAGSDVSVVNHIRYYVLPEDRGTVRLMRMVDGGANTLIGGLKTVRFQFFTRGGELAMDVASIARVRIEAESGSSQFLVTKDIAVRSQL